MRKYLFLLTISTIIFSCNSQTNKNMSTEHKHTNDLIHETSPYLLQHAHNPVNWHAWNKETWNMKVLKIQLLLPL